METYNKHSMVKSYHIEEIDNQLKNFGSKVPEIFLGGDENHALSNLLQLALGNGTYGISLGNINKIMTIDFEIRY